MAEIAIGIDLGTSNSCVAVSSGGSVEVLANAYGERITASVVAFCEDGTITVGNAAKANIIHEPERTIHSSKRLIGRYFFSDEAKKAQAVYSYKLTEGENHDIRIQVGEEIFTLPEIGAMVLREMKSIAECHLGQPVDKAVITVPAYFNDNQRQATKDAGRIAGLEVLRILNEPTAAALAYGFGRGLRQRVAVWDLGGGTFDISVLEIGDDVFEVLATAGDTFLGGDDFDDRLMDLLADEFASREGINLRNDPYALEKLKVAAESAKKALSEESEVEIRIPDVIEAADGNMLSIERTLRSEEYASLVNDLIQRTFKVCDEALQQASVIAADLDGVILVGGPTRLPIVREAVCEYFQQQVKTDVDPDQVVAMGAAIHAASLVSPENEAYLLDVTPLSLKLGVVGGLTETVIERNTPVPIEQTRTFTTVRDQQETVEIRIYQGEWQEAEDNELLGQFTFSDFQKGRRGEVEIDVTFEINTDGIVNVTARDRATGRYASARITLAAGLSEGQVDRIIEEGRTERVQTSADQAGRALGAIPLQQVAAEGLVEKGSPDDGAEGAAEELGIAPLGEGEELTADGAVVDDLDPAPASDEAPPVAAPDAEAGPEPDAETGPELVAEAEPDLFDEGPPGVAEAEAEAETAIGVDAEPVVAADAEPLDAAEVVTEPDVDIDDAIGLEIGEADLDTASDLDLALSDEVDLELDLEAEDDTDAPHETASDGAELETDPAALAADPAEMQTDEQPAFGAAGDDDLDIDNAGTEALTELDLSDDDSLDDLVDLIVDENDGDDPERSAVAANGTDDEA